jgi:hypothetical protein
MIVRGELIVGTVPIAGGVASEGVFRHELASGLVVVEKKTRKQNEIAFCENMVGKKSLKTVPQVFDVVKNGRFGSVFMEHADLLGYGFLAEEKAGIKMARFFYDLHCELDFLRTPFFDNSNAQMKHLVTVEKLFQNNGDLVSVKKLREVRECLGEHGRVFYHNDLFLGNIGVRGDGGLVAFDFGLVAPNFVGAEFHHFLGRSPKMFFEDLLNEYSRLSGLSRKVLEAGAILYAGIREFKRKGKGVNAAYCRAVLADSVAGAHSAVMVKFD